MRRFGRGRGRPDAADGPTVSVSSDPAREGWVVVTLRGSFLETTAVDLAGTALLQTVLDGGRLVAVELSEARIGPALCRALIGASQLLERVDGWMLASGLDRAAAKTMRRVDVTDAVPLTRR